MTFSDMVEAEIGNLTRIADEAEEMTRSAMIASENLARVVRLAEAEQLRRDRAVARYNTEVDRLSKFGARALRLARHPQPLLVQIPPVVGVVVRGRREIEAAANAAAATVDAIPMACGVYFLLSGEAIVYVGQSVDVVSRMVSHIKDPSKRFDRACWFPVPKDELDDVEGALIALLKPEQNRRGINIFGDESLALSYGTGSP